MSCAELDDGCRGIPLRFEQRPVAPQHPQGRVPDGRGAGGSAPGRLGAGAQPSDEQLEVAEAALRACLGAEEAAS